MQENALDPSHASYVHNLVISKRQDAAPMHMALSGDIDAQQGFTLEHGGYSKSQQEGNMKAKRYFIPPCTIRCASSVPKHAHCSLQDESLVQEHTSGAHKERSSPADRWPTVLRRLAVAWRHLASSSWTRDLHITVNVSWSALML